MHFFIIIYLSYFILERVMFVRCERWVETRTDCYFHPSSSLPIVALLPHLGRGCLTGGPWGPKALCLQAGSHSGILSPTDSNCLGTWLYHCLRLPASAFFLLIYTGASLDWRVGRGSIYNTSSGRPKMGNFPASSHWGIFNQYHSGSIRRAQHLIV